MHNPFSLENKKVFVTGASSGIGKAVAIECAKMGAAVIINGRNEKRLNETFTHLERDGHVQIVADLAAADQVSNLVSSLPVLDGLVHCAGITKPVPFPFINKELLHSVFDINFTAPALMSMEALKKKKFTKNSSIVFISSVAGVWCSAVGSSVYSASKGAVNGLIKGMALDLAPKGIRVNSVNAGMIDTQLFAEGHITQDQFQEDMMRYPLKRYGRPEEVAYAVIYLLSDASRWITGSNLLIDGGYTLL